MLGPAGERCPGASTPPAVTSRVYAARRHQPVRVPTTPHAHTCPNLRPNRATSASLGTGRRGHRAPPTTPCDSKTSDPDKPPGVPSHTGSSRPAGFLSATLAAWIQHRAENAPWETETPRSPPGQRFNDRCPSPRRWKASAAWEKRQRHLQRRRRGSRRKRLEPEGTGNRLPSPSVLASRAPSLASSTGRGPPAPGHCRPQSLPVCAQEPRAHLPPTHSDL